jgi:hypothetical protein
MLHRAEINLAAAFREVAVAHRDESDIHHQAERMARQCDGHAESLGPFVDRYGEDAPDEPDRLHSELFTGSRTGGLGLLRDLHDLYLMACQSDISWTLVGQAAQGARDRDLLRVVSLCEGDTAIQVKWLMSRMKTAAPQALIVAG